MSDTERPIVVPYTEAVKIILMRLDGTPASAIRLLTDVDDLSEYGGMPDGEVDRIESGASSENRNPSG